MPEHLEVLKKETGVMPVINQIELHPYFNQAEQRAYHQQHGILTMAWSPLGRARDVFQEPVLQQIAEQLGKSVAQIILKWQIQLGVIPIPKATSGQNQLANKAIFQFELSDEQMQQINALTRSNGRLKNQDPAVYEEF